MAQKVEILLLDDIDGSEAVCTVRFGLDGQEYECDLNADHSAALRTALSPFITAARTVKVKKDKKRSAPATAGNGSTPVSREVLAQWARDHGYDLKERGRIPTRIQREYEAANT